MGQILALIILWILFIVVVIYHRIVLEGLDKRISSLEEYRSKNFEQMQEIIDAGDNANADRLNLQSKRIDKLHRKLERLIYNLSNILNTRGKVSKEEIGENYIKELLDRLKEVDSIEMNPFDKLIKFQETYETYVENCNNAGILCISLKEAIKDLKY